MNSGKFRPKYAPIQIGEKINFWTVVAKGSFKHNQQRWLCSCECGFQQEVAQQHLRSGKSSRCRTCSGKECSRRSFEKNFGMYNCDKRKAYVSVAKDMLYEDQKGICTVCGEQLPLLNKCAWDHDHKTGKGRDLLHTGCNIFLGFIERDPDILNRVVQYCEKYKIEFNPL